MDDANNIHIEETLLAPILDAIQIGLAVPSGRKAETRIQQLQFIITCAEGIQHRRDVVIEGPTGLGKTRSVIAAIIPFLRENPNNRVLYLTRTITQIDNIIREINDICLANDDGRSLLSSVAVFGATHMPKRANCWDGKTNDSEVDICKSCRYNTHWDRLSEVSQVNFTDAYNDIRAPSDRCATD